MTTPISFTLPLRLASANVREHPHARARRVREQRMAARVTTVIKAGPMWGRLVLDPSLKAIRIEPHPGTAWPISVIITRIGPRTLDTDNLAYSAKAVRDGIADAFGIDDGDESAVQWSYAQERGEHAVGVYISDARSQSDA